MLWPVHARVSLNWAGDWYDGTVAAHRSLLTDGNTTVHEYQVAYDDGAMHWHDPTRWESRRSGIDADAENDATSWQRLELRCCISLLPLVDPARGEKCMHSAQCNYSELRACSARTRSCPVLGCDAPIPRTGCLVDVGT